MNTITTFFSKKAEETLLPLPVIFVKTDRKIHLCIINKSLYLNALTGSLLSQAIVKHVGPNALITSLQFDLDFQICGRLRDLVPFVQFKKHEKQPWRNVNFGKVAACNVLVSL